MEPHLPELRALGADVWAIALTPPRRAAAYLERYPLPLRVAVVPGRKLCVALGLGRTTWWSILSPPSIGRYLAAILRGTWPRKPVKGEDLLQLGGEVVVDAAGVIRWLYRSRTATDRPRVSAVLKAVAQAAATSPTGSNS